MAVRGLFRQRQELRQARSIRRSMGAVGFRFDGSDDEFLEQMKSALPIIAEAARQTSVSVEEAGAAMRRASEACRDLDQLLSSSAPGSRSK